MPWMYILRCADGSYYVGSTIDLQRRIVEHNEGIGARYTARRRPVELVYSAEFPDIRQAYAAEKQVQGWSRAKREALIRGDFEALPGLAKKDFNKYHAKHAAKQEQTARGLSSGLRTHNSHGGVRFQRIETPPEGLDTAQTPTRPTRGLSSGLRTYNSHGGVRFQRIETPSEGLDMARTPTRPRDS